MGERRITSVAGCVWAAAALWAVVGSALAQQQSEATSSQGPVLQEVVVTAEKRSERELDVPISVTTVDSQTLVEQDLNSLSDYYQRIPGLQYGGGDLSQISLRGITTGAGDMATLGVLVDDVPFGGSNFIAAQPLPDFDPSLLDHIEVLRGPQGTLYGAESLGGLIKFVTKDPDTNNWSGRVEVGGSGVSGGNQEGSARGAVNIPLISDHLALSASVFYRNDPEYINNVPSAATPNVAYAKDVNKVETYGGRTELMWKPVDSVSIYLSAMRQEQQTAFGSSLQICPACQTNLASPVDFTPIYGNDNISQTESTAKELFTLYSGRVNVDFGWSKLTSITAYNESNNPSVGDVTPIFGPGFLFSIYNAPAGSSVGIVEGPATNKFSQEVRLASQGGKLFDWLVGVFYTRESSSDNQTLLLDDPSGALILSPYSGINDLWYDEKAGFGDVTLHATSQLDIQLGARYSSNTQIYTQSAVVDPAVQPIFGNGAPITVDSRDHATTWLITPSYHFTPDEMGYIRVASGYRPGGPNTSVPTIPLTFGPDTTVSYEAGFKGDVIPHQLSIDVDVFQINWHNIQLQDTDAASQFVFFTNGGTARSRGSELSLQWLPTNTLNIGASLTYTDAVLTQNLEPSTAATTRLAGEDGERLPYSAKFTANLDIQQNFPISDRWEGFVGANYSYVGDRYEELLTSLLPGSPPEGPRILMPAYNRLDLRGGFNFDQNWHIDLYVRNATNDKGVLTATNRGGTSTPTAVFITPLTVGLNLSWDFGVKSH